MKDYCVEGEDLKEIKILIVEDMNFTRNIIGHCMKLGFPSSRRISTADGRTALERLRNEAFDLILCDWGLPDISGLEILRWVRESSRDREIPFIMITVIDNKEIIMEAIQAGVTDYVIKPIDSEILIIKAWRALKNRRKSTADSPEAAEPILPV